jgi:hypothetical protein
MGLANTGAERDVVVLVVGDVGDGVIDREARGVADVPE